MSKKTVSLSIFSFQRQYGDMRAIEIAKEIGLKAVDFCTDMKWCNVLNPDSFYAKGDEAVIEYYSKIRKFADENGIKELETV